MTTHKDHTALLAEIGHLRARISELEREIATRITVYSAPYGSTRVRMIEVGGRPCPLSQDIAPIVFAGRELPESMQNAGPNRQLKQLCFLGPSEMKTISRTDLGKAFGYSSLTVCNFFGMPPQQQGLGVITAAGIDRLDATKPGLKKWFAHACKTYQLVKEQTPPTE